MNLLQISGLQKFKIFPIWPDIGIIVWGHLYHALDRRASFLSESDWVWPVSDIHSFFFVQKVQKAVHYIDYTVGSFHTYTHKWPARKVPAETAEKANVLFIFTLHVFWKLAKFNPNLNIISKYLSKIGPTILILVRHSSGIHHLFCVTFFATLFFV